MLGETTWRDSAGDPQLRKGQELAAAAPFRLGVALYFLLLILYLCIYCVGAHMCVLLLHLLIVCVFAHVGECVLQCVCV